jgi:hypothetical protein
VEPTWTHVGNTYSTKVPPTAGTGPWVVRVDGQDDFGDAAGRDFLELDRPLRVSSQETALLGVRKAQVKLAAYYLSQGSETKARMIAKDMASEPAERLASIRRALETVTSKDFWEITDRGRTFEFMPEKQRSRLAEFFGWLNVAA